MNSKVPSNSEIKIYKGIADYTFPDDVKLGPYSGKTVKLSFDFDNNEIIKILDVEGESNWKDFGSEYAVTVIKENFTNKNTALVKKVDHIPLYSWPRNTMTDH